MAGEGPLDLHDVAVRWLAYKRLRRPSRQGDIARRSDLAWWGRQLTRPDADGQLELERDLAGLTVEHLSVARVAEVIDRALRVHAPSTVARRVATLRGLCKHLSSEELLGKNPFDSNLLDVAVPRGDDPKAITVGELERLIGAAERGNPNARSAWPVRDVALLVVLAYGGLRASEAVQLRWSDVEHDDPPALRLRRGTKGGRHRTVPIGPKVINALEALAAAYDERGWDVGPSTVVFRKPDGRPLTPSDLWYQMKRIAALAGVELPEQAAVHGARHHFGVELARAGVDVFSLQSLLGHGDPRTTSMYTKQRKNELAATLLDAGWLAPDPKRPRSPAPEVPPDIAS